MAKKKIIIAAILVGSFAGLLGYLYLSSQQKKVEKIKGNPITIVKAARKIPAGTRLTKSQVTRKKVPERYLPDDHIKVRNINIFLGRVTTADIQEGDYVLTSDFSKRNVTSALSSRIPLKERALSIPVDNVSGVSGLLNPGDRIDILGTFKTRKKGEMVEGRGGKKKAGYVTMTLLQNVSILAVGQRISNKGKKKGKGGYGTITVSVSVEEAELITIAQTRGELMMLLRNRNQVNITPPKKRTLSEVLEELELIAKKRVKRHNKRVKTSENKSDDQKIKLIKGSE